MRNGFDHLIRELDTDEERYSEPEGTTLHWRATKPGVYG